MRFETVDEYYAVNSFAISLISLLINPFSVGHSCVPRVIFLFSYDVHSTDKESISNHYEFSHNYDP